MEVTVQIPESSFSALRTTPEKFAREMKLAAVVKWYELGRISQSKGAERCGVSRAEFLRILADYKESVIQYDEDSLPHSSSCVGRLGSEGMLHNRLFSRIASRFS